MTAQCPVLTPAGLTVPCLCGAPFPCAWYEAAPDWQFSEATATLICRYHTRHVYILVTNHLVLLLPAYRRLIIPPAEKASA